MTSLRRPTQFYRMVSQIPHQGSAIAESTASDQRLAPMDERLIQAIWNEQMLKSDVLVTADGRPVKVFDPGKWNGESGPDFRDADVSIGQRRFRGDVEIHVYATEWERHGHQKDFDYNNVVLHVVLHRDDSLLADELHNGTMVPRLTLEDFLEPDLETIRLALAGEDYFHAQRTPEQGPGCHLEVARLTDGFLCELLDEAARERMETRVERYAHQAATTSLDEALYQALMTIMGHKGSKTLFFLLARRVPIDDLRLVLRNTHVEELPLAIETILLQVSGLANYRSASAAALSSAEDPAAAANDTDTEAYRASLNRYWAEYERFFSDRLIPPTRRWMANVRPVNFPMRRVSGMARFLAKAAFGEGLTAWLASMFRASAARYPKSSRDFKRELKALAESLTAGDLSYWCHRYTLGGRRTEKPMLRIGGERAYSMLFNAVLPIMLLYARHLGDDQLEKYLWRLHGNFPALQENTITKFMKHRLLPAPALRAEVTFRLESQNQALIHIYHQCCANSALTCENCVFKRV